MEETEERTGDEDIVDGDETEVEPADAASGTAAPAPRDAAEGDVGSIEELIVKKEAHAAGEEEEEDESAVALTREERLEPLAVKVVPPQSSEFVCKKCYLVKHRSQLKDKNRMLCRDCA